RSGAGRPCRRHPHRPPTAYGRCYWIRSSVTLPFHFFLSRPIRERPPSHRVVGVQGGFWTGLTELWSALGQLSGEVWKYSRAMAKGKPATGLLREVIDELAQLAHKGQAKWAKYSGRSRLDNIERFVREEKKLPPEQRPPGKQVCETIEAACESLPDHEWRQAA